MPQSSFNLSLKTNPNALVCIGIRDKQEPDEICDLIVRRFSKGKLSGIAGVMLIASKVHEYKGVYNTIDIMGVIKNGAVGNPLGRLGLKSMGLHAKIDVSPQKKIPAYYRQQ